MSAIETKEKIDFSKFNRSNFIRLDTSGSANVVTCLVCGIDQRIEIKDNFVPYREVYRQGKRETRTLIKTNKEAYKRFCNNHYYSCVCPVKE